MDDFLALGLITLSYGIALLVQTYGFLAVFSAGVALRQVELRESYDGAPAPIASASDRPEEALATDEAQAPGYLARAVLQFNEQLEHIGEVVVVILVGTLLFSSSIPAATLWFAPLLLLVIRPVAVFSGTLGTGVRGRERLLMGWFGIRGIGSIYCLMFAIEHGLDRSQANELVGLTLAIVAVSVVVHGISVTPLMERYGKPEMNVAI